MLINFRKIYTKEEFENLLESDLSILIGEYDEIVDGETSKMADYYIPIIVDENDEKLLVKDIEKFNELVKPFTLGTFTIVKLNMLKSILDEARDRLWFNRHAFQDIKEKDIRKENYKNSKRISEKYSIGCDKIMDDFTYGYWSGILATIRYLISDYSLNDLRNAQNSILDL